MILEVMEMLDHGDHNSPVPLEAYTVLSKLVLMVSLPFSLSSLVPFLSIILLNLSLSLNDLVVHVLR